MAVRVYVEPWDIRRRLESLGVALGNIQKAGEAAHAARVLCTPNDPTFIPGTEAYRFAVRTLREELLPTGKWRKDDPNNYALVINDEIGVNIGVASGDAATGRPKCTPRTKTPRGLYTYAAIERNNLTGDLFPETLPKEVARRARALAYPTWIFLVYTSAYEVRAELSFPESYDAEDEEITSWKERIIIPGMDADPTKFDEGKDSGPDLDIDVRLKS